MKKNFKIGMGLAMASIVSMAAVIPVFADVKPSYIEKTGTVIAIDAENTASGTAAGETANETGNKTVSGTDHSKSPNLCKLYWDGKAMAEKEPEVKPSDYKDEAIRKIAEEYVKKGYFLSDCKFVATHYSSGIGFADEYVFCNGFSALEDNKGNNKEYIQVVKATPEEFEEYVGELDVGSAKKNNGRVIYNFNDDYKTEQISYDEKTQIMIITIMLNPGVNAVG
jgi:hypothetical protein